MQEEIETDKFNPCGCGETPNHYTIGYGRTAFNVICPGCKKQLADAKCKISGWVGDLVDYWNEHLRLLTPNDINNEIQALCEEREEADPYNEYTEYQYYWSAGRGEYLVTRS